MKHEDPVPGLLASAQRQDMAKIDLDSGEARLMRAILDVSLADFCHYRLATGRRGQRLFQEARRYLFLENDWVYSAENICCLLGLSLPYLCRGLQQLADESHPRFRRAPWQS